MENLQIFLSQLDRGIDELRRRIAAPAAGRPAVSFNPKAHSPGPNEVLIGIGSFSIPATVGISLNNKAAGPLLETSFSSVTQLVLQAPAEVADGWRAILGDDCLPERFFRRFTLVVEDASPDSCFGLISFLIRLNMGVETIPQPWVRYIDGWEQGEVEIKDSIRRAYGYLHAALVDNQDNLAECWCDALALMADGLRSGVSPLELPESTPSPVAAKARAYLTFEEQAYHESLNHATRVQLLLPMVGGSRSIQVDAYLSEQTLSQASTKLFIRSDRNRSYLKRGFTVMAIYRANARGDGYDFTVSVDPSAGVELSDLWRELERQEDQAWADQRPSDKPRMDSPAYPGGRRDNGASAPNQPWHHDPAYSLVAAPKMLDDGRLGSKLNWQQLCEILWQTYQPLRDIKVRAGFTAVERPDAEGVELRSLDACFPETIRDDTPDAAPNRPPRLFIAGWHRPDNTAAAFFVTPTLCRYLAGCIRHWPRKGPLRLDLLADDNSYQLLELAEGIAIVTDQGAFILHDGRSRRRHLGELRGEFERARRLLRRIEVGGAEISKLLDETDAFLRGTRRDLHEEVLLHRLSAKQIEITQELNRLHAAVVSPTSKLFRQALLKHWGIEGWLDSLARDVDQIKSVVHSKTDLDTARNSAQLHTWAVPAAVAIGFIQFGFEPYRYLEFAAFTLVIYAVLRWGPPLIGRIRKWTGSKRP